MKFIKELKEGESIREIYLCKSKKYLKTKTNKDYISCEFTDKTGYIDAKIFDITAGIREFEEGDYVLITARVNNFNSKNQLIIDSTMVANPSDYEISNYLKSSDKDMIKLEKELKRLINLVTIEGYKKLLCNIFNEDSKFYKDFIEHAAAKKLHHGYRNGLLEHTVMVGRKAEFMANEHQRINKSLLITGALLHDMAKVYELSKLPNSDYTDLGNLVGHITYAVIIISKEMDKIPELTDKQKNHLIHLIISHHGELEYGSPKKPQTLEAIALHLCDNADANIQIMLEILENEPSDKIDLGYNKLFDAPLRRTDI